MTSPILEKINNWTILNLEVHYFSIKDIKMQTGAEDEKVVIDKRINEIIRRMVEINDSLKSIEVYQRDDPGLLESTYNPIGEKIESFFKYINKEEVTGLSGDLKKRVYQEVFARKGKIELLFLAQNLRDNKKIDADMLLVCASRASRTKNFLFLCDTALIRNILDTGAQIPAVSNLGILHHYSVKTDDEHLKATEFQVTQLTEGRPAIVKAAVESVLETIPKLINENIKNTELKVVLRCCRGGQQAHLLPRSSPPTKLYPIGLLPIATDAQKVLFDAACKENDMIVVKQEVNGITEIFLPNMRLSKLFTNTLPILTVGEKGKKLSEEHKRIFIEFSKQLIRVLNDHFKNAKTSLYIDPYKVSIVEGGPDNELWRQGKNLVMDCFKSFLEEWETPSSSLPKEELQRLSLPKLEHRGFFAPANSLKDKMRIHENTYAGQLLAAIRGDYVDVFKTYYGGYNAYKDKMVQQSRKGDISDPKSIIVTREKNYMDPMSEGEPKAESSPKKVGGGA